MTSRIPTHVVMDTSDGYIWWRTSMDVPMTLVLATAFAHDRNAEMKPEHRTYRVYALTEVPAAEPQPRKFEDWPARALAHVERAAERAEQEES
jgi:hypothetical protein